MNILISDFFFAIYSLNECLRDSQKVNQENRRLRDLNTKIMHENQLLRAELAKRGITIKKAEDELADVS